jgi:hypothetical protein
MARTSHTLSVNMEGFSGGLNKDADVARLEPDETPELLNGLIGLRGEVYKRPGYSQFDTNLAGQIEHLNSWRAADGSEYLMAIESDGDVHFTQDTTQAFTSTGTNLGVGGSATRHPIGFTTANGFLYFGSRRGHDTKKFDGVTVTNVAAIPSAQHLLWRYEQLFVSNIAGSPSQMQISLELDPEDFATEPAIFQFDVDDGDEIRAMVPSGEDLLIFKDHSIHTFTGKVRSDFAKYRLDSLRGTVSPLTVKQVRGLIIFFDRDTGVWAWDGAQFALISEKINEYILNNVTYDHAYVASAYVRRDAYILSLPWQTAQSNQRTFVYSTLTNSWTEWDYGVWDATQHASRQFAGSPRGQVGVYETWIGSDDDGSSIPFTFKTPWMHPGGTGAKARLRRIEMNMTATAATVDVDLFQDYFTAIVQNRQFTADNPNGATETDLIKNLDGWGGRAAALQLQITTDDMSPIQLNNLSAIFSVNRDRMGEHV